MSAPAYVTVLGRVCALYRVPPRSRGPLPGRNVAHAGWTREWYEVKRGTLVDFRSMLDGTPCRAREITPAALAAIESVDAEIDAAEAALRDLRERRRECFERAVATGKPVKVTVPA